MTSLESIRKAHYKGLEGKPGDVKARHGKNAKDTVVTVPIGTTVYQVIGKEDSRTVFYGDIKENKQRLLISKGGEGGKGNFLNRSLAYQSQDQFGLAGEVKYLVPP